jgi:seryl-tRNA synthetase
MLDPKLIRENFEKVKKGLEARKFPTEEIVAYAEIDRKWRSELVALEEIKCKRNKLVPKGKPEPEQLLILKQMAEEIKGKNESVQALEKQVKEAALGVPNLPDESVPIGDDEESNLEIRKIGVPSEFSFKPKPHEELAQDLGILDFEKAAKITGSRFVCYKGAGAKLERALINFMLDIQTKENNYLEIIPPAMVNSQSMLGTGQLPKFASDSFQISDTDFWLSPTAEVQLTNLYRDSVVQEDELPIYLTACTPCFRKEAGSYGKDITGIIRQHQFNKVELVKIVKPEDSFLELDKLLANAEQILKKLGLPYRVVTLCTGDLGFSSTKTYDIEVWFPAQNRYREISSCSNFLDFQSRRAMIRYKSKKSGVVEYAHTLNGSGLAVGRTFAALLENYQNKDGSITLPKELIPYFGEEEIH